MPEGQFTGNRKVYEYVSEVGTKYLLQLDSTLGDIPGCGLTAATTATAGVAAPKRFKPRVVFWEGTLDGKKVRKQLVCNNAEGGLYDSEVSKAVTIDGVAGVTTGRRGEKFTYMRLAAAT